MIRAATGRDGSLISSRRIPTDEPGAYGHATMALLANCVPKLDAAVSVSKNNSGGACCASGS